MGPHQPQFWGRQTSNGFDPLRFPLWCPALCWRWAWNVSKKVQWRGASNIQAIAKRLGAPTAKGCVMLVSVAASSATLSRKMRQGAGMRSQSFDPYVRDFQQPPRPDSWTWARLFLREPPASSRERKLAIWRLPQFWDERTLRQAPNLPKRSWQPSQCFGRRPKT